MKRSLSDVEILERRRHRARHYRKAHGAAVQSPRMGEGTRRLAESAFTGAVPHKPCPPPNAAPGITLAQLMSGRAKPFRTQP